MLGRSAADPNLAAIRSLLGGVAPKEVTLDRPKIKFPRVRQVTGGSLKPTKPSIAQRIESGTADALRAVGANNYDASRWAGKLFGAFNDLTPVGNVTGAQEGYGMLKQGITKGDLATGAAGLGSLLLSVLPFGGGAKKKPLQSLMKDESGAIRAYHGSPHDFDRFDISRIGTGEGAQAYGHGLYFAENRRVAEDYQRGVLNMPLIQRNNARMTEIARDLDGLAIPGQYGKYRDPRGYDLKAEYDALMEAKTQPGRLYEVNINAEPEDFLDWDAPTPAITSRIEGFPVIDAWKHNGAAAHVSGQTLYRHLADGLTRGAHLRGAPTTASQKLKELGLPGIRYLDQGSRGAADGTRNYVVFDDSLIDILKKY